MFAQGGIALAATTSHTEFACSDSSTAVAITKDTGAHQEVVTCKSGASILYVNYDGYTPTAVNVTCPRSTETIATSVDAPNKPTSKYTFYCALSSGTGDNQTSTRTTDTPTAIESTATQTVRCSDGTLPSTANDLTTCGSATADTTGDPALNGNCSNGLTNCDLFLTYINPLIKLLAAFVGLAVTISIIIGGIQYGSSAGDPKKVTAAKNRIRNAIVALATFIFLYALLNFLIPGGLF